jgi:aerobic carbon-monoxide dehydrogenase medium subunit
MYPSEFKDYRRPSSLTDALELARQWGESAMYVAGGMSLMQGLKSRLLSPDYLIDLNDIDELRGIHVHGNDIRIGAMTRYREVAEAKTLAAYQALGDAAGHVGDRQVRNRGTIGGSLCWNYVSACIPVAVLACGAKLTILRSGGVTDQLIIDDFLQGPLTTALEAGDLLYCLDLQKPELRAGSAYRKWGVVKDALPVIGVGVFLTCDSGDRCVNARIAVGGLEGGPQRLPEAENNLTSSASICDIEVIAQTARIAAESVEAPGDPWISADYKVHLIERLTAEMLTLAANRARRS